MGNDRKLKLYAIVLAAYIVLMIGVIGWLGTGDANEIPEKPDFSKLYFWETLYNGEIFIRQQGPCREFKYGVDKTSDGVQVIHRRGNSVVAPEANPRQSRYCGDSEWINHTIKTWKNIDADECKCPGVYWRDLK